MTRMQAITTAREMFAGGWKVDQIRRYLRDHGQRVTWKQVKCWIDPEYAERRRAMDRERVRRAWRRRHGVRTFRVMDEDARARLAAQFVERAGLDDSQLAAVLEVLAPQGPPPAHVADPPSVPNVLLALRLDDGLSYSAIAAVARRFLGMDLTEEGARAWLYELGVQKNPNKARTRSRA